MPPTPRGGPNGQGLATDDTPSSPWAQPPAVPVYRPVGPGGVAPEPPAVPAPTSPAADPTSPGPMAPQQPVYFPGQPPPVHSGGHHVPVQHPPAQPPVQPPTVQPPVQYPPAAAMPVTPAPTPAPAPRLQPPSQQQAPLDDPNAYVPTADEFARRRVVRPSNPVATMGMRGAVRKSTFGLVKPGPGRKEREHRHLVETIRRNFGGLRQVTVVNPKGGAGKTVAVLLLSMTFGQKRGGYILAWDNNETQGTLGMRAQQDFHSRTVRDLMRDLDHFHGAHGRVGDLSQYVRSQGEGMFDVLASDESATAGEMLTAASFGDLREVVSRFYKLIFVDTGNNVRAENWQAAIDATDQLVVTMSARNDSAETAARMLDHLEQNGRHRLVRQAVTVVSMPPSRRDLDVPSITRHFAARTRTVMLAPYERLIDSGEPIRYAQLSAPTRLAWLRIGAAVAEGL
jgi:MinD-like ATPase involved in chromosome partitioning or flagellar assembly